MYPAASPTSSTRPAARVRTFCRSGPAARSLVVGVAAHSVPQLAEGLEVFVEAAAGRAKDRDADTVVGHGCHICLGVSRPVHLNRVGPWGDLDVPADAPPTPPRCRLRQSQCLADRRVQPIGSRQVPCLKIACAHRFRVLGHLTEFPVDQLHAGRLGGVPQRGMQHGPAHPTPGARPKRRVDPPVAVDVADST